MLAIFTAPLSRVLPTCSRYGSWPVGLAYRKAVTGYRDGLGRADGIPTGGPIPLHVPGVGKGSVRVSGFVEHLEHTDAPPCSSDKGCQIMSLGLKVVVLRFTNMIHA